jgi:hypothetical protein
MTSSTAITHHLAGVWRLLWARDSLQLTLARCVAELVPAALVGVWWAGSAARHTLPSLAGAAPAGSAVGFGADFCAKTCVGIALVLQQ